MATPTDERPAADEQMDELAALDSGFRRMFGEGMTRWPPETRRYYNVAAEEVFTPNAKAVLWC